MKRRWFVTLTLLLMIPGLLFTASCSKKKVKPDGYTETGELPIQRRSQPGTTGGSSSLTTTQDRGIQEGTTTGTMSSGGTTENRTGMTTTYERESFVNEDIYFPFDSSALSSPAQEILRRKAEYMRMNSGISVEIEGHCDERGTNEYNMALGDRRARSVKEFMVNLGISSSRMRTISYGEEQPVDYGSNEAAWTKNRRAHFVMQ